MPTDFTVRPLGGLDVGAKLEDIISGGREVQRQRDIKKEMPEVIRSGDPDKIAAFMVKYPEMAGVVKGISGYKSEEAKKSMVTAAKKILIDGVAPEEAYEGHVRELDELGEDPTRAVSGLGIALSNPDAARQKAEMTLAMFDHDSFKQYRTMSEVDSGDVKVGAQEILESGAIIQSTPSGPVVYDPEGNKVKGRKAAEIVAESRALKVSNLRKASAGKRAGALEEELKLKGKVEANVVSAKDAAVASGKAFDKVEKIYENIQNMNEGIRLIEEEGADTGAIMSRLPSVKAAAVKLDNLQARLGLDVIGNTTFGALSEAELKFALSAALPQGLEGQPFVDWMKEKIRVQEVLADYLEQSAIYLGTPGNTKAGWLEYQKNKVGTQYGREQTQKTVDTVDTAPQAAIDYLTQNPHFKDQFKSKYGYLPEGL